MHILEIEIASIMFAKETGDYDGQKFSFLYLIHLSCSVHHPTTEVEGELK